MERAIIASVMLLGTSSIFAANHIDLSHFNQLSKITGLSEIHETSRMIGPNNVLHVRVQQEYNGYPVFGGDAVLHYANGKVSNKSKMNGTFYQFLNRDLASAKASLFTKAQSDKALSAMVSAYTDKDKTSKISQQKSNMLIYVDDDKKAHYAYRVSFFAEPEDQTQMPKLPTYIVDADNFKVYKEWDDLHTAKQISKTSTSNLDLVEGGGFGGNTKVGQLVYDGAVPGNLNFTISRNAATNTCYMQNSLVTVKSSRIYTPQPGVVMSFPCGKPNSQYNNVYWSASFDQTTGGYSPANDVMYNTQLVNNIFSNLYHMPILTQQAAGSPSLAIFIHYGMAGAFLSGNVLSCGDGMNTIYFPFTTRDIIAHEMSHIITQQYSGLIYTGQSGGLNESFGDMTAKLVEMNTTGTNSWDFAADVVMYPGEALRYMDQPSKDCSGKLHQSPCSFDNMGQYKSTTNVGLQAGIFNQVFYFLATSPNWNTKRAYDVMLRANMHYWTSNVTFAQASCGVLSAAQDLGYEQAPILNAFQQVGLDTSQCLLAVSS